MAISSYKINFLEHFLTKNIPSGIFNTSNECFTINKLAKYIQRRTKSKLIYYKSNDVRSYRLNSDKLIKTGFSYKYKVEDAINDLTYLYSKNKLKDNLNNYNLKKIQKLINSKKIK